MFYDVTDETVLENLMLLNRLGILSGYEDGSFKPADNVTRSSFVCGETKQDKASNGVVALSLFFQL